MSHSSHSSRSSSRTAAVWLVVILTSSLVPRLPVLYNAAHAFNSDEAVNALVIKHMLEHGELTLHNWDATYYGIVEGLLAIPFVWIDGYTPLAFKLSAVAGFLFLLAAAYLLGARLFGRAAGLAAAGLLAAFSPQLVLWSTLASGGYTLVIAWGTLTFVVFDRLRAAPGPAGGWPLWKLAAFGVILGFGLYIYELYLVYVAVLALYAAALSLQPGTLRALPRRLAAAALLVLGLAVGWAPKLALLFHGGTGTKKPAYAFADPHTIERNLTLLAGHCAPSLLGANPAGAPDVARWTGAASPLSRLLGILLLSFYAAAWLWGLRRSWPRIAGALGRRGELDTESLLVLLVPVTALLFVLSRNPQDVLSARYLLPWLSALPVFGGALLVRLARRSLPAAALLGLLLVALPLFEIARVQQIEGYLGPGLRPALQREPIEDVLRYLRSAGIRGAYGPYWFAYEATFLSGEAIEVAPVMDWDRNPASTRRVEAMRNVAYVFDLGSVSERRFLERLGRAGRPYEVRRVGPFAVYTSPRRERLLPAYAFAPPRPLAEPRARIEILGAPGVAAPGEVLAIPVRVTNTGSEGWSAAGTPGSGAYRVAVSYRWLDPQGAALAGEPERTLLPEDLPPGGTAALKARVPVPARPGSYQLRITLVQEGVAWFDQASGAGAAVHLRVEPAKAALRPAS